MGGEGLERVGRMGEGVDEAGEADAGVLEHPLVVVGQKVGHQRDGVRDEVRALEGEVAAQVGGGGHREALDAGREEINILQHGLHAARAEDGERVLVRELLERLGGG